MSKIITEIFNRNIKEIKSRQDYCWIIVKNKEKFLSLLDSTDYKECKLYLQDLIPLIPNEFKGNKLLQFILANKKVLTKFLTNIT